MEIIEKESRKVYQVDFKKTTGEESLACPECSPTRKDKKSKCFGWNHDIGAGRCNHCELVFYVKKENPTKIEEKKYVLPKANLTQLSEKTLKWFNDRGISQTTLMRFKISEGLEWMPQDEKEMNTVQFGYYINDQLINVKYRTGNKHFKLVKDAKLVFYNLDSLVDKDTCTIVEGEIDCLSMYEAGIYSCISVPNGASKSSKLEYLDNCWQYFEDKKTIIIATDSDGVGVELRDELARRLGRERCKIMPYPEGCKDSNDVLVKHGANVLKKHWEDSYDFPMEGVKTLMDFDEKINDLFINGYPSGKKTGFAEFDKYITWASGQVTVVTGIPNSGKSEFTDQILVKMAMQGEKVGMFSAENQPEEYHFAKLAEKFVGKSFSAENSFFRMSTEELMKAKEFVLDHFFFVELKEENLTVDAMIDKIKELVLRKGINFFMIDPWNYLEHNMGNKSETQYIGESLTKFCNCAKRYKVHIIIVAHPTKIQKDRDTGKYKVATLYDIAGSANWFNKVDNGLSVYVDRETQIVEIHIQKIRFKWIGKLGMCQFKWDYYTGRYKELNDNTPEPVIEEPKKITTNSTVDWNNPTNDIVF